MYMNCDFFRCNGLLVWTEKNIFESKNPVYFLSTPVCVCVPIHSWTRKYELQLLYWADADVDDNVWTCTHIYWICPNFFCKLKSVLLASICIAHLYYITDGPAKSFNPRPSAFKSCSLPTELPGLTVLFQVRYHFPQYIHRATHTHTRLKFVLDFSYYYIGLN